MGNGKVLVLVDKYNKDRKYSEDIFAEGGTIHKVLDSEVQGEPWHVIIDLSCCQAPLNIAVRANTIEEAIEMVVDAGHFHLEPDELDDYEEGDYHYSDTGIPYTLDYFHSADIVWRHSYVFASV